MKLIVKCYHDIDLIAILDYHLFYIHLNFKVSFKVLNLFKVIYCDCFLFNICLDLIYCNLYHFIFISLLVAKAAFLFSFVFKLFI